MVLPGQQNSHPPSRRFWMVVALLLGFMLILRLLTYGFSLPYVDHPDEPNYYLAAQEVRSLFDNQGYYDHAPPAYIYLATVVQVLTEPLGAQGMAAQVRLLRLLAVLLNLGTLVFIALAARRADLFPGFPRHLAGRGSAGCPASGKLERMGHWYRDSGGRLQGVPAAVCTGRAGHAADHR